MARKVLAVSCAAIVSSASIDVRKVETGGVFQKSENAVHRNFGVEVDDEDRDAKHLRG